MPKLNTLKSLGSLFRSSIKSTPATTTSAATAAAAKTSHTFYEILKHFVSSHKRPQPSKPPSPARPQPSKPPSPAHLSVDLLDSVGRNGGKPSGDVLKAPYLSDVSNYCTSLQRKQSSRKKKEKWFFKKGQVNHVNRLVDLCARLGTDDTLNMFGKLGREIGMKEFNAFLKIFIENASTTDDETVALEQVSKAFEVFMLMKDQGFPIEEESYGQVLLYLIDRGMVEQFHLFTDVIKDGSASTLARLGYYEMLLYTRVNDEEKVQEICNCNVTSDGDEAISLRDVVSRAVVDGGDC